MDVAIEDRLAGRFVQASLIDRIDLAYAQSTDDLWLTFVAAETARAQAAGITLEVPEHAHWIWARKVQPTAHLISYPTLAIEFEGQAQGLMLLKTDGEVARLPGEQGKPLVYVVYLASAPWNLPAIVQYPRFRGVGATMLRAAIETSIALGFKGRVGLHSLPQSEGFYAHQGMTELGNDPNNKEYLDYFEMTPEQAMAFIR